MPSRGQFDLGDHQIVNEHNHGNRCIGRWNWLVRRCDPKARDLAWGPITIRCGVNWSRGPTFESSRGEKRNRRLMFEGLIINFDAETKTIDRDNLSSSMLKGNQPLLCVIFAGKSHLGRRIGGTDSSRHDADCGSEQSRQSDDKDNPNDRRDSTIWHATV